MRTSDVLQFWGKARPGDGSRAAWHPIAHHLLDVAAVADTMLAARPITLRHAGWLLGLADEDARRLLVALTALHDLGKFAPPFQRQATPERWTWPATLEGVEDAPFQPSRHTSDGLLLWQKELRSEFAARIWSGEPRGWLALEQAIFGHHGLPVEPEAPLAAHFSEGAIAAARQCTKLVLDCVLPEPVRAASRNRKRLAIASWWVAGFMTVADWVGSRQEWFEYTAPLENDDDLTRYWSIARERASAALYSAGLGSSRAAPLQPFTALTQKPSPTPTQEWAESVDLSDEPLLAIIEDATGSGKTEAAQMLVHRLMASGRASGAYWAMPTQATANAMYGRQRSAISALFAPDAGPKPSLTLGHGQARVHEGYRSTVIRAADRPVERELGSDGSSGDAAAVACAAFLADDRRAALLADIGVGTVDQALLGVLPSRFNAVRLFALAEKVLVLDEVHAFDAYMSTELKQLLQFHAALGGSAVLLSATLSEPKRRELERAWRGDDLDVGEAAHPLVDSPYPMATLVTRSGADARYSAPVATAWSTRTLPVRLIHSEAHALEGLVQAANAGAAVVWIRNTVDECVRTAALFAAHGLDPLVFHARFAQGDRQRIESEVMRRFGPKSEQADRRGAVLVATQVVEQSLDLDFDAMVSDLAPVDLLIQRAGRLWRHRRVDRPTTNCELVVLSPDPDNEVSQEWPGDLLRHTRYVYPNPGVLWRTAAVLKREGEIAAPARLRALIRDVYDGSDLPSALTERENAAIGEERADAGIADYSVLAPSGGYETGRHWTDDLRARTRLGEEQVAVRLARVESGHLVPWYEDSALPEWHRWLLSEVKLSGRRVAWDAEPSGAWRTSILELRSTWGKFEQRTPVAVMETSGDGQWAGVTRSAKGTSAVTLTYSTARGAGYG